MDFSGPQNTLISQFMISFTRFLTKDRFLIKISAFYVNRLNYAVYLELVTLVDRYWMLKMFIPKKNMVISNFPAGFRMRCIAFWD